MKYELKTAINELKTYDWLYVGDDDIEFVTDDNIDKVAKRWNVSPEAVKDIKSSIDGMIECLIDAIAEDLEDIFNKIE